MRNELFHVAAGGDVYAHFRNRGFTLIELMIAVAIVAILASIAYPSYADYVVRGKLVDATDRLSSLRAQMEQYFQDNRTYAASGAYTPPCLTASTAGTFGVQCLSAPTASAYTITATGSGVTAGFVFSIDQDGNQLTTGLPSGWGSVPTSCWVLRRGGSC